MGYEVDPAFVQEIEHRPKIAISEAGGIPLIDLSLLSSLNPDDDENAAASGDLAGLVWEIEAACRDWGFFQVINHGVPLKLLERVQAAAKKFFALPLDERRKVRRDEANPVGYSDAELTKNVRDWKELFDFQVMTPGSCETSCPGLENMKNQWPADPPELREACEEYARGVVKLAFKLFELISLSLNLPAKRFNGFFKDQTSIIRLNHYPPCPSPHLALGVGRHKDSGALTILSQDDVGGLDVRRKSDGEWVRVKPIPYSYVINVGAILQVWSNDKYESVEHRVSVNSDRERFSIPFFFNPAHYLMVKPVEELVNEKNPPRYREYSWGEFFKARRNSNLKKMAEENLQISHFKIPAE